MNLASEAWGIVDSHPFKEKILENHPSWCTGPLDELATRQDLSILLLEPQSGIVRFPKRGSLYESLAEKYKLKRQLPLAALSRHSHESDFMDSLEYRDHKLIPRSIIADHGPLVLSRMVPGLNTSRVAFLTLGSPWVWPMVRVLVALGFKRFSLLIDDSEQFTQSCIDLSRHFKAHFFDLHFETVPSSKIVVQKPEGSLLLNLLSQQQIDQGLNNLRYLNFLGKNSILINSDISAELGLLQEAHELGLTLLTFEDLFLKIVCSATLTV